MPHPVTCGACNATFSIPDEVWDKRVHGQVATLKCRQCKAPIEVDGRVMRRGSAVNITTSAVAVPSVVHPSPQVSPSPPRTAPAAELQRDSPAADLGKPLQAKQPEQIPTETKSVQTEAAATIGIESALPNQSASELSGFSVKDPGPIFARPHASGNQVAKQAEPRSNVGARNIFASSIANTKLDAEPERELS